MKTGWIISPQDVEASTVFMGGNDILVANNSRLKGFAGKQISQGVTGAFLWLAEKKLFGSFGGPFYQRRGTCVGQGTARAGQDSLYSQLVHKGLVSRAVHIAVAPVYAGGRVQVGGGRLRGRDGLVGAWAAQFVSVYGFNERKRYPSGDLSRINGDESYAVSWGDSRQGVPRDILEGCIPVKAHRCMTGQDMADALFSKCAIAFCGRYTGGSKDQNGYSRLNSPANHCTEVCGAFIDVHGDLRLVGQQSWGSNNPSGPDSIATRDYGRVPMRDGMWASPVEDFDRELRGTGEAWAFEFELEGTF